MITNLSKACEIIILAAKARYRYWHGEVKYIAAPGAHQHRHTGFSSRFSHGDSGMVPGMIHRHFQPELAEVKHTPPLRHENLHSVMTGNPNSASSGRRIRDIIKEEARPLDFHADHFNRYASHMTRSRVVLKRARGFTAKEEFVRRWCAGRRLLIRASDLTQRH
jgi:hypothetical protein